MSIRTQQRPQMFIDLPPNDARYTYTPEPTQWTYFVGYKMVPRMFKPAIGGAASRDGHGWPYDMSGSTHMGTLTHLPVKLVLPDKRSGLTTGGDALRQGSAGRIPSVLVRDRVR